MEEVERSKMITDNQMVMSDVEDACRALLGVICRVDGGDDATTMNRPTIVI